MRHTSWWTRKGSLSSSILKVPKLKELALRQSHGLNLGERHKAFQAEAQVSHSKSSQSSFE